MSFGGSKSSMGMPLSWLIRIYSDQYFRDFAEIAHSADGDYTYDPDVDADWELSYALEDYEARTSKRNRERSTTTIHLHTLPTRCAR